MIDGVAALSAAKSASQSFGAGAATNAAANAGGADFGQVLSQVIGGAIDTVKTGEAMAIQGLEGSAPAFKVVEAVMAAQRTLQSALAIRDKAVSAYQEISRMAI
ncbi:MAG TPA: flagellar hook-basal body complex protein FliE [Roseiarcus sp.]|nr:flagellar hook-basal body complex protein FliE [Roseiarcus sp.]